MRRKRKLKITPSELMLCVWIFFFSGACQGEQREPSPNEDLEGSSIIVEGSSTSLDPLGLSVPTSEQRVLARMGAEVVTVADFERMIRQRALVQGVSPEIMAPLELRDTPEFVLQVADSVFQQRRLLTEATRLELLPTQQEILDAWQSHPSLANLYETDPSSAALGSSREEVAEFVQVEMVHDRWVELVIERFSEEDLWTVYHWQNETVLFEAFRIPNIPTSEEVESFITSPPSIDWFETVYQDEQHRFEHPEAVDVTFVRYPLEATSDANAVESAEQSFEQIHRAVQTGADVETLLAQLGRPDVTTGRMERVVSRQLPGAFELVGSQVSPIQRDEEGLLFYWVLNRYDPYVRPLDHILRREIAYEHLSHQAPLPAPTALAEQLISLLETSDADVDPLLTSNPGIRRLQLGPMRFQDDGFVSGIGHAPELHEALFSLTEQRPVAETFFHLGSRLNVVRILSHVVPTREQFDQELESFAAAHFEMVRATAWETFWLQQTLQENIELVEPLP